MEMPVSQPNFHEKKMAKQLSGKREDTPLHAAARAGNLDVVKEILSEVKDEKLFEMLSSRIRQERLLYMLLEYGHLDMVNKKLKNCNLSTASIKAKNGYDALHIAASQGNLDVLKELVKALPELAMTVDVSNITVLHTAAAKDHLEAVSLLFDVDGSLEKIARSNGKFALHSSARNGHLEVMKVLLDREPGLTTKNDRKGQTALYMVVKGQNLELVEELHKCEPYLVNTTDSKGNTALHIATRKGRSHVKISNLSPFTTKIYLFGQ